MAKTTHAAGRVAAGLAFAALTLSGCGTDPVQDPETIEEVRPNSSDVRIDVNKVIGDGEPQDVSILCVDGSAFLYVYTSGGYDGGPALSRFPERDALCEGGQSSATSMATPTDEHEETR